MINKYLYGFSIACSIIWGIDAIFDITNPLHIVRLGLVIIMLLSSEDKKQ